MAVIMCFVLFCACSSGTSTDDGKNNADDNSANTDTDKDNQDNADKNSDGLTGEGHKIALSADGLGSDFAALMVKGVQAAQKEYGFDLELRDANMDASTQSAQVENLISMGYEAILLKPNDESACGPISDACEEAGVPLVVITTQLPTYYTTSVGGDNVLCGQLRAQAIVDHCGENFKLAIVQGVLGMEIGQIQYQAAMDVFAKYPGIEIVANDTANNKRDEALELVTTWINGGIEFDAIWASNDASAIGSGLACKDAGLDMDKVFITGNGGAYEACQYIEDGIIDGTVHITGYDFGYNSAIVALKILNGEEVDHDYYMPLEMIVGGTERFKEVYEIEKALQEG